MRGNKCLGGENKSGNFLNCRIQILYWKEKSEKKRRKIRKKKENPVYAAPRKPVTTVLHKPFRVHTMLSSASNDRHGDILATTGSI